MSSSEHRAELVSNPQSWRQKTVKRIGDTWQKVTSVVDPILVLTLVLSVIATVEVVVQTTAPSTRALAIFLNLVVTLSLALREWHLVGVAAVATGSILVLVAFPGLPPAIAGAVAELILLYHVAREGRRRVTLLFGLPFLLLGLPIGPGDQVTRLVVFVATVFALITGDGQGQRERAVVERDTSRLAMQASERERVAIEERTRIARELHDVVAHHLSMIAVQAESSSLTSPGLTDQARQDMSDIGDMARSALTEMRRLLGVLRTGGDHGAPREPQPGLDRLAELVDFTRGSGIQVTLTVRGKVEPLANGVDLAAYRILQEALTNARRHADGADIDIDIRYEHRWLHLRIHDHGPGPKGGRVIDGHGLTGMKERASMVSGAYALVQIPTAALWLRPICPLRRHCDHPSPDRRRSRSRQIRACSPDQYAVGHGGGRHRRKRERSNCEDA